jgi:hypothetical protein
MRTYDVLGWNAWGWTPPIGVTDPSVEVSDFPLGVNDSVPEYESWARIPDLIDDVDPGAVVSELTSWDDVPVFEGDVSGIREVISTFGENVIALCELFGGNEAIYHSPNSGDIWKKVLEVVEIYDITSVGYNWTLASTSAGWYSSLKAGSHWDLVAPTGPGVPVGRSVVWVAPNHLFAHDGAAIWLSEDRAASWVLVCDLTTMEGYSANLTRYSSIDGYQGRIIATCGHGLIETRDLGSFWDNIDLTAIVRGWGLISTELPVWRQIAFWDTLDALDPAKSRWMISMILTKSDIIRTFVGRGTGTFSPVVDMALSERHRLNVSVTRRAGADLTDTNLLISGDRRIRGELRHAIVTSDDGLAFSDVLGGSTNVLQITSSPELDAAHVALSKLLME